MSWSFSVKEKTAEDALRMFGNALVDSRAQLPQDIGDNLMVAATALAQKPPKGCDVLLSSSGHMGDEGTGYGVVRFEFVKSEFVPPHLAKS
jgi:hypothetical protein